MSPQELLKASETFEALFDLVHQHDDNSIANTNPDYYKQELARIAELESLVEQLIWVGNDLLVSNTNPVTITLFNGLVCNAKERER